MSKKWEKNIADVLILLSCTVWPTESHPRARDSSVGASPGVPGLAAGQQSLQLHDTRRQVSTAAHIWIHVWL